MNLGFKDQFVSYVEEGSKTHTIRAGDRWKVGMRADLYARPRQKGMRLIFRAPVVRVQEIEIIPPPDDFRCFLCGTREIHCHQPYSRILIDGEELGSDERDLLAWRDGFRPFPETTFAFDHMMEFWRGRLPFHGQVIHWDYTARFVELPKKPRQRYCESIMCADYGEPVGAAHSCRP